MFLHCSCSKFTTTTSQFPFYNSKLHFTTAQIVISCTLKYSLIQYNWHCQSANSGWVIVTTSYRR